MGGSIATGVSLSLDALYNAAAMLPRIAIEPPPSASVIGRDTVGQMQIGIYWGYVSMIEGMIARMKADRFSCEAPVNVGAELVPDKVPAP